MEFKIDYIVEDIQDFTKKYIDANKNNGQTLLDGEFKDRKKLYNIISNLHASDQAIIFTKLGDVERVVLIQEFTVALHEDIILFLEPVLLSDFFHAVGMDKFLYMLALIELDEVVEVLENFDEETRNQIIKLVPFKKRIKLKRSLSYPEFSCGRNMSVDFLSVPFWWTVARTKKYIKDSKKAIENEDGIIFVTDEEMKVIGTVSVIKLLNQEATQIISKIFDHEIISVKTYDSIPNIAYLFDQYDLDILPVVNKSGNIVGVLEIAEVVEYLQESSEKQILRSVGVFESKSNTVFGMAKPRFWWLVIDFFTAVCASYFISLFEGSIAKVTTLAVLMPIVSTMGGNCGSQTATVIIRSIFVGSITKKQMMNEIFISILNGIGLASLCFLAVWGFYGNMVLGAIFGVSVLLTLILAGLLGVLIPITLKKLKIDPPVGTSILLTTVTDICGFVAILSLGTIFLM